MILLLASLWSSGQQKAALYDASVVLVLYNHGVTLEPPTLKELTPAITKSYTLTVLFRTYVCNDQAAIHTKEFQKDLARDFHHNPARSYTACWIIKSMQLCSVYTLPMIALLIIGKDTD